MKYRVEVAWITKEVSYDGYALTRRAEDDEIPDLWSVYEVQEDGVLLCIADFWDVDRGQGYVKWLLER